MAMAALSPNSILATPIQVNPQVKSELQSSAPQVAQAVQKAAKTAQTDTITISAQALKMADGKDNESKENAGVADGKETAQLAQDKAAAVKNETQRNAVKAYADVTANK